MTATGRPTLDHVLVATDLTPGAAPALRRAAALPLHPGATVSLLHVVAGQVPPRLAELVLGHARELLASAADELRLEAAGRGCPDLHVRCEVVAGTPFVEIVRHARRAGADLVVVGRHGPRPLGDAFVGTTAARVLRKGDVPVLLANADPTGPHERVLVALDLSDASPRVVELALALLPSSVRTLRLVHAYHVAFEGWLRGDALDDARRERAAHALEAARSVTQAAGARGLDCRLVIREGDPRTVILEEAVRERCDLVVLGTHARAGLAHALLGSVAEWLVRAAPCDVAVTRPARFTFELP
jgi:nucleotide-binding universal stress UspA family protein